MIAATKKEPTIKKIVNIPDSIITDIDENAIGEFVSRADFLSFAIRDFTKYIKERQNRYEKKVYDKNEDIVDAALKSLKKVYDYLREMRVIVAENESEETTSITLYLTEEQITRLESYYNSKTSIRNLQEFAKIAAYWELDDMERISEGYVIG